ncbi:MAG: hypothetical protein WBM78_09075 [Desulfobacterales bacterium]
MQDSTIYRARVRNQAKLAYNNVAAWFEDKGPMPAAVAAVPGLAENLRLQYMVAQQYFKLPAQPDSKSLEGFLAAQKTADPLRFADLSLAAIKLLGPGE